MALRDAEQSEGRRGQGAGEGLLPLQPFCPCSIGVDVRDPDVSPQGEAPSLPATHGGQEQNQGVRGSSGKGAELTGVGHRSPVCLSLQGRKRKRRVCSWVHYARSIVLGDRWRDRPALALPDPAVHLRGLGGNRSLTSTSRAAPAGRREWLRFQEAEYKFFEHHSTWAQAQRICTWFQAELTSVHSQAELDFLGHTLQKVGMRGHRVGRGVRGGALGREKAGPGLRAGRRPALTFPSRFPSSPGARSSTGGSACTPPRATGASGGRRGACVDEQPHLQARGGEAARTQRQTCIRIQLSLLAVWPFSGLVFLILQVGIIRPAF